MRKIFKYPLVVKGSNHIDMPECAEILCAQIQDNAPYLWALIDSDAPTITRRIYIIGTGHETPDNLGRYIGTVQMMDGALVWHIFDAKI